MRSALIPLLFSAGALAFGQAGPASPFNSGPFDPFSQHVLLGRDIGKLPTWHWDPSLSTLHSSTVMLPRPKQARAPLGDASIDPKIVRHPSPKSLGTIPPGTQVAQNLYPGLTFQPIDDRQWAPNAAPLSTTWPKLKVQPIPITWPNMKKDPVGEFGQASSIAVPEPRK